jgi:eukaryotic-like serine/threonine-protein kinase
MENSATADWGQSVGDQVTIAAEPSPSQTAESAWIANPPPGFSITLELGRGGMGVVFLGQQQGLNRPVALKLMLGSDQKSHLRFLAESEAIASIRHPNVVEVYQFGEHLGRPFLALEYCPEGSLDAVIQHGALEPRRAAEWLFNIASGVQAAHEQGIVHRDLKPHNILLCSEGQSAKSSIKPASTTSPENKLIPKVTDFGLAKRGEAGELTKTQSIMGTPAYMPPEQARGETKFVGPQADVWALGVILYEMLTGRRPFQENDHWSTLSAVIRGEFPKPRQLNPNIPRDLELICLKCLSQESNDRYATAGELAEDVQLWLNGEQPKAAQGTVFTSLLNTLGRGHNAQEFQGYAALFLWMSPVIFFGQLVITLAVNNIVAGFWGAVSQYTSAIAILALFCIIRRGQLMPRTPLERLLWSLWGGYILTCLFSGISLRLIYGWAPESEIYLFPQLATLTALAYFCLGAVFWGWFYAFGIAFLILALLMPINLWLAPIEFGTLWSVVLLIFWRYLSRYAHR